MSEQEPTPSSLEEATLDQLMYELERRFEYGVIVVGETAAPGRAGDGRTSFFLGRHCCLTMGIGLAERAAAMFKKKCDEDDEED